MATNNTQYSKTHNRHQTLGDKSILFKEDLNGFAHYRKSNTISMESFGKVNIT